MWDVLLGVPSCKRLWGAKCPRLSLRQVKSSKHSGDEERRIWHWMIAYPGRYRTWSLSKTTGAAVMAGAHVLWVCVYIKNSLLFYGFSTSLLHFFLYHRGLVVVWGTNTKQGPCCERSNPTYYLDMPRESLLRDFFSSNCPLNEKQRVASGRWRTIFLIALLQQVRQPCLSCQMVQSSSKHLLKPSWRVCQFSQSVVRPASDANRCFQSIIFSYEYSTCVCGAIFFFPSSFLPLLGRLMKDTLREVAKPLEACFDFLMGLL